MEFMLPQYNKAKNQGAPLCIIVFRVGLKEFLERCVIQFYVYIWSMAHCHNIYKYLDEIWHINLDQTF
jgi:hypothetical protein